MSRSIESIEPPDCYQRAAQLATWVELIRVETGRGHDPRPPIVVKNAAPREVWFQALAVFRKADRLCHELTGDPTAAVPHAPPIASIMPGHVLAVLDATGREIEEIMNSLNITERPAPGARDASKTPSDVFGALATMNRQVNLLLERPFAPSDVFQQVSFAVAFAARLTRQPPPDAPFERAKRPTDCYQRLAGCLELARNLARAKGHAVIDAATSTDPERIQPSDVYDLATLVLGEVAFLHALEPDPNPPYPFEGNMPGRKLPSHVYQLVGVLEQQLRSLSPLSPHPR